MAIDKKVHPVEFQDDPSPNATDHLASASSGNNANMGNNPNENSYQSIHRASNEEYNSGNSDNLPPPAYAPAQPSGPWNAQASYEANRRKRNFKRAIHWTLAVLLFLLVWRVFTSSGRTSTGGPYPPSSDGSPSDWAHWSTPIELPRSKWPSNSRGPYMVTSTNFTLDPSASSLFLHAKGPGYGGRVDYVLKESSSGNVEVGVEAVYVDVLDRDQVTVVKMEDGKQGQQGVGIYSENSRRNFADVNLYVTFALPREKAYKTLEGDIENLSVHFADFSSGTPTTFSRLDLQLGNGAVNFEGGLIASEVISIHSKNGKVNAQGRLEAPAVEARCDNGALVLQDVASPSIDASSANAHVEGTFHISRKLVLRSDNGAVDAKVYVEKAKEDGEGADAGRVEVDANSSNGHVTLTYLKQDADVLLFSNVKADMGHASVRHANTFVGKVELGTEMGHLDVRPPRTAASSSSSSSQRQKKQSSSSPSRSDQSARVWHVTEDHKGMMGHKLYADLYWRDSPDSLGHTSVRSEMGSVDASFD
ncbi:unnamed protein product [Tilletia controversa]|nr:unnamed protein product [Tilletia controversa]